MITIDDIKQGQRVRSVFSSEIATVETIDYDENVVWVREAIPGHAGQTDLIDVDPGDLVEANE